MLPLCRLTWITSRIELMPSSIWAITSTPLSFVGHDNRQLLQELRAIANFVRQ
jgi:hypothetical protein